MRFLSLPDSKVEMKEYKEPKIANTLHLLESLVRHVTLQGVVPGVSEGDIRAAIYHSCGILEIRNIVIKKTFSHGDASGEARVELIKDWQTELVRKALPLTIKLKRDGAFKNVLLKEKEKQHSKKNLRQIRYLESQGLLNPHSPKAGFVEPVLQPGHSIFTDARQNNNIQSNLSSNSSFRAVLTDVNIRNQSKLSDPCSLDLNLQRYLQHEKNLYNIAYVKSTCAKPSFVGVPRQPFPQMMFKAQFYQ